MNLFIKILFFLSFISIPITATAQETWEEYVLEARIAHTAGNEEQAINMYKRALQVAPNNREKVRLHSILAGLYRFSREFQQNIDHLESGVELMNKTGEGKEFADDLYLNLCGMVLELRDHPISKDESYCESYWEKTNKYRREAKYKNRWTRSLFGYDLAQTATDFKIPLNFPMQYGLDSDQVDPFGEDTNRIFYFFKHGWEEIIAQEEPDFEKRSAVIFKSNFSFTISFFEDLEMEKYVKRFITNFKAVEPGAKEIIRTGFSTEKNWHAPTQEVQYLKFENYSQTDPEIQIIDEFLIARKGDLFIILKIQTFQDEASYFNYVLSNVF